MYWFTSCCFAATNLDRYRLIANRPSGCSGLHLSQPPPLMMRPFKGVPVVLCWLVLNIFPINLNKRNASGRHAGAQRQLCAHTYLLGDKIKRWGLPILFQGYPSLPRSNLAFCISSGRRPHSHVLFCPSYMHLSPDKQRRLWFKGPIPFLSASLWDEKMGIYKFKLE